MAINFISVIACTTFQPEVTAKITLTIVLICRKPRRMKSVLKLIWWKYQLAPCTQVHTRTLSTKLVVIYKLCILLYFRTRLEWKFIWGAQRLKTVFNQPQFSCLTCRQLPIYSKPRYFKLQFKKKEKENARDKTIFCQVVYTLAWSLLPGAKVYVSSSRKAK